jgi:hypothetical protein
MLPLVKTCAVKHVISQKYPSNRSQDTKKNLYASANSLTLITEKSNKINILRNGRKFADNNS